MAELVISVNKKTNKQQTTNNKQTIRQCVVQGSNPAMVYVIYRNMQHWSTQQNINHISPVAQRKRAVKHRHLSPRQVSVRI